MYGDTHAYFLLSLTFFVCYFRWAAASGDISLNSLILPAALYFWQIPHFMALAYLCRDDYAAGGYAHISFFIVMKFCFMQLLLLLLAVSVQISKYFHSFTDDPN